MALATGCESGNWGAGLDFALPGNDQGLVAVSDLATRDAQPGDMARADAGPIDASYSDANHFDASPGDANLVDANLVDANHVDASQLDAALVDASQHDAAALPRGPAAVVLGTAGDYVILAKTAVSTVPISAVTGNIGLSPAAGSFVTGFSLVRAGAWWTSAQVTGQIYSADNDPPTPINLTTSVNNMQTAYTDAAGRLLPDFLNPGAGAIGGLTLVPGLYKWTSSVTMASDVILAGGANDTWIFQVSGDLSMADAVKVTLQGGAKAKNVVWQVAGIAALGTNAHFEGVLLCKTAITLLKGASVNGRLLAQTAVNLIGNAVTQPAQ